MKEQKCHKGKHSERLVTVFLCSNMDGTDRQPVLVISRSKKPHCFKANCTLSVTTANEKLRMARAIFASMPEAFGADMRKKGRHVGVPFF